MPEDIHNYNVQQVMIWIHAVMAEISTANKMRTEEWIDGWTGSFSALYSRHNIWILDSRPLTVVCLTL